MRARNIKPNFLKDEDLAECSFAARLLAPGLWMMADREGRLEDRPKRIKGEALPYDNVDVDALLNELQTWGHIIRYEVDGKRCIQIRAFTRHQRIHPNEVSSTLPPPPEAIGEKSPHDEAPQTLPQGEKSEAPRSTPPRATELLNAECLNEECSSPEEGARKPVPKSAYPPLFEEFWSEYPPTNCSKKEALPAFERALKRGVDHETIMRSLGEYRRFLDATGTPAAHATTWLNQDRWTVDYEAATKQRINGKSSGNTTGAHAGSNGSKVTWASEADRLAAKYLAEAEAEKRDEQRGQSATVLLPEPSMRSTAALRQNGGGTGGNG